MLFNLKKKKKKKGVMKAQRSIPAKAGMGLDTVSSKQELVR